MEVEQPGHSEESLPELEPLAFPIVSVSLLLVISLVFAAMLRVGHGDVTRAASLFGDKENGLIRAGQWWRLVTPIFLHGGWGHIIANGLTLLMLGIPMERIYGPRKFFLIYMLAGIAGNVCSYWFSATPSLGASGALYGLMGAGLVFPHRFASRIDPRARREILTQLARAAIINIGINFLPGLNLDRWAHFGGLAGGGLAALLWMPDVLEEEALSRAQNLLLWGLALAMLALLGLAGWKQWQTARQFQPQVQAYYVMDANDPWWGLLIPHGWRQADTVNRNGIIWNGPGQTRLQILDNREVPSLVSETQKLLLAHRAQFSPFAIDGVTAQKAVFTETEKSTSKTTPGKPVAGANAGQSQVVELYQVTVEGRAIDILLSCPAPVYARMQPVFLALLSGVRFVRPPGVSIAAPH